MWLHILYVVCRWIWVVVRVFVVLFLVGVALLDETETDGSRN